MIEKKKNPITSKPLITTNFYYLIVYGFDHLMGIEGKEIAIAFDLTKEEK